MGLGGMKYAWQRQTKDFAHTKADQYSSLVLDNRGIGESDKPTMRYSTSDMAKDIVEVLDHIGWAGQRDLHVIGISMGGMIAQELVRSVTLKCVVPLISLSHNASHSPENAPRIQSFPSKRDAFLRHHAKHLEHFV
jgi:esterase/lipase